MNNYEYCADFARRMALETPNLKILDYGCGNGEVVRLVRDAGLDAHGCDTFYEGYGGASKASDPIIAGRVHTMDGERIPFEDGTFDLVTSNMVLEHVENIDIALSEISRVLKPGGKSLNLFPHLEVWREGHCNIPFVHRFPKGSKLRVYYAAALQSLGVGYFPEGKSSLAWASDFCDWLDEWTHYRSLSDIDRAFHRHFPSTAFIEDQWIAARIPRTAVLPTAARRFIARRFANIVVLAHKN